jgi:hypothetical protein
MKKFKLVSVVFISMLLFAVAAYPAKSPKPKKTPKPTVSSLTRQLNEAKDSIETLSAQKVSLTAKVSQMDIDLKRLKKDSDAKFFLALGCGLGTTIICLAIIIILTGAKNAAAGTTQKKKKSNGPDRESHFEELEYNVLDDWHNIWFHPEKVNNELYMDLANHFPELHEKIEKWKYDMAKRNDLVDGMNRNISVKFKEIEATPSIYLLALGDSEFFIDENEIHVGTFVCAHAKPGYTTTMDMMQAFYNEVIKMMEIDYSEIKAISVEISDIKIAVDIEIRRIKHHRKLPGDCKFISA